MKYQFSINSFLEIYHLVAQSSEHLKSLVNSKLVNSSQFWDCAGSSAIRHSDLYYFTSLKWAPLNRQLCCHPSISHIFSPDSALQQIRWFPALPLQLHLSKELTGTRRNTVFSLECFCHTLVQLSLLSG